MRGQARGADCRNEGRDKSGEREKKTGGECMMKEGRPWRSPFNIWDAVGKEKTTMYLKNYSFCDLSDWFPNEGKHLYKTLKNGIAIKCFRRNKGIQKIGFRT